MPRRVRTAPKRYVPDGDTGKPKPQLRVTNSETTKSQSESLELDDGHQIRGRSVASSPIPHVLREIHQLQSTTKLQIPKLSFSRLIREVLLQYTGYGKDYRITAECLECLQEAAEIYIVQLFEDSNRCCAHRDRVILHPKDMKLALFLREKWR
ncbi:histone H3-5-like [Ochlerotatus camptorhynchus]|uniref:histone H3-5-like n=1 Tax=Ochlerotatus camptorhynchus TaxID=644619 RepID=UPI0031D41888